MDATRGWIPVKLNLHAGEFVEVRSEEEIFATLDENGCIDNLPFMPEMLKYCGQRFRVFKSAHKTCDTISKSGLRRLDNAVHLENIRCDGEYHGDCQATCLIFWKESWLKRIKNNRFQSHRDEDNSHIIPIEKNVDVTKRKNALYNSVTLGFDGSNNDNRTYICQITKMFEATHPISNLDLSHYIKDLILENICFRDLLKGAIISIFNMIQRFRRGRTYPFMNEKLIDRNKTPRITLDLMPGDMVRIKDLNDILVTLDNNGRNKGLSFDDEMVKYCGRTARVFKRVEKIINENTGRMSMLSSDCLILDGVTCKGDISRRRMFCPRGIYPFWREIWLEKITGEGK